MVNSILSDNHWSHSPNFLKRYRQIVFNSRRGWSPSVISAGFRTVVNRTNTFVIGFQILIVNRSVTDEFIDPVGGPFPDTRNVAAQRIYEEIGVI